MRERRDGPSLGPILTVELIEDLRWCRGSGPSNQVGRGGAETGTAEEEWVSGRIKRSTRDTLRYSRGLKWRCQIQS